MHFFRSPHPSALKGTQCSIKSWLLTAAPSRRGCCGRCRRWAFKSVAVYSEADTGAPYLELASETYAIGRGAGARQLPQPGRAARRVAARAAPTACIRATASCRRTPPSRSACSDAGVALHRPVAAMDRRDGTQDARARARGAARHADVAGIGRAAGRAERRCSPRRARSAIPVLVKPAGGGGGIGMLPAKDEAELLAAVERSRSMAEPRLRQRRGLPRDACSSVRATSSSRCWATATATQRILFERDCSVQRRNQKVIEEAPAPGLARAKVDAVARQDRGDHQQDGLRQHRHGRDADGRGRLVQLSRDEHAAAGRARRDRGSDRRRSRQSADPFRRRRAARRHPAGRRSRSAATRSRRASTPKTRRIFSRRPAS